MGPLIGTHGKANPNLVFINHFDALYSKPTHVIKLFQTALKVYSCFEKEFSTFLSLKIVGFVIKMTLQSSAVEKVEYLSNLCKQYSQYDHQ